MLSSKKKYLEKLIDKNTKFKSNEFKYPLLDHAYSNNDIIEGIKVLLSQQLNVRNNI